MTSDVPRWPERKGVERAMNGQYLQQLVERHKALALAIAREFPEADEETLLDTIEGASDLPPLLAAVLRSRIEDLGLAEALRQRLEAMRTRLERIESRAEQKRVDRKSTRLNSSHLGIS